MATDGHPKDTSHNTSHETVLPPRDFVGTHNEIATPPLPPNLGLPYYNPPDGTIPNPSPTHSLESVRPTHPESLSHPLSRLSLPDREPPSRVDPKLPEPFLDAHRGGAPPRSPNPNPSSTSKHPNQQSNHSSFSRLSICIPTNHPLTLHFGEMVHAPPHSQTHNPTPISPLSLDPNFHKEHHRSLRYLDVHRVTKKLPHSSPLYEETRNGSDHFHK